MPRRNSETASTSNLLASTTPARHVPSPSVFQRSGPNLHLTVLRGENLKRNSFFKLPDPFVVVTADGTQTHTSLPDKSTINPYWNAECALFVNSPSRITVQVFDQKRFSKDSDGRLGVASFLVKDVFESIETLTTAQSKQLKVQLKEGVHGEGARGTITMVVAAVPSKIVGGAATPVSDTAIVETRTEVADGTGPATPTDPTTATPNLHRDELGWLPPGWERRLDAQGRAFYIDHNTRTTTWVRPPTHLPASEIEAEQRAMLEEQRRSHEERSLPGQEPSDPTFRSAILRQQQQLAQGTALDLPPGWERRIAPNGQYYYIDHNTQRTTWIRPTPAPAYSAAAAQEHFQKIYEASVAQLGELPNGWEMRMHSNNQIYFVDHNTHSTTWDDPRLPSSVDADCPEYKRNFQQKLAFLRSQPEMRRTKGITYIDITRNNVFMDSFEQFGRYNAESLRRKLTFRFDGEEALDYGGVAREFYFLLSHEMFNPIYCLFEYASHGNYTLQICPRSDVNPEHLDYFKFIGRVVGTAIFHQRFLDAFFVSAFYKQILGVPIVPEDLETIDPELWKGIQWMLDDNNDVSSLCYTFSVDDERFGEIYVHDLKPDGRDIEVTQENKHEYIKLLTQFRIVERIRPQMDAFCSGLFEIVPQHLLSIFDDRELEMLIGGINEIDLADWRKYTDYRNCEPEDPVCLWFWRTVEEEFNNEQRAKLIQFVTGTSRVPIIGFKGLQGSDGPRRFTIEVVEGDADRLPMAHTCFNRIDLPKYKDYESMRAKLSIAIEQSNVGFAQE